MAWFAGATALVAVIAFLISFFDGRETYRELGGAKNENKMLRVRIRNLDAEITSLRRAQPTRAEAASLLDHAAGYSKP